MFTDINDPVAQLRNKQFQEFAKFTPEQQLYLARLFQALETNPNNRSTTIAEIARFYPPIHAHIFNNPNINNAQVISNEIRQINIGIQLIANKQGYQYVRGNGTQADYFYVPVRDGNGVVQQIKSWSVKYDPKIGYEIQVGGHRYPFKTFEEMAKYSSYFVQEQAKYDNLVNSPHFKALDTKSATSFRQQTEEYLLQNQNRSFILRPQSNGVDIALSIRQKDEFGQDWFTHCVVKTNATEYKVELAPGQTISFPNIEGMTTYFSNRNQYYEKLTSSHRFLKTEPNQTKSLRAQAEEYLLRNQNPNHYVIRRGTDKDDHTLAVSIKMTDPQTKAVSFVHHKIKVTAEGYQSDDPALKSTTPYKTIESLVEKNYPQLPQIEAQKALRSPPPSPSTQTRALQATPAAIPKDPSRLPNAQDLALKQADAIIEIQQIPMRQRIELQRILTSLSKEKENTPSYNGLIVELNILGTKDPHVRNISDYLLKTVPSQLKSEQMKQMSKALANSIPTTSADVSANTGTQYVDLSGRAQRTLTVNTNPFSETNESWSPSPSNASREMHHLYRRGAEASKASPPGPVQKPLPQTPAKSTNPFAEGNNDIPPDPQKGGRHDFH